MTCILEGSCWSESYSPPYQGVSESYTPPYPGVSESYTPPYPGVSESYINPYPGVSESYINPYPGVCVCELKALIYNHNKSWITLLLRKALRLKKTHSSQ